MANFTTTGSDTFPAGHVVATSKTADLDVGSHIYTSNASAEASGIIVSTSATSGSNYNIIQFTTSGQHGTDDNSDRVYLYTSKDGASYSQLTNQGSYWGAGGSLSGDQHDTATFCWVDTAGLTSGTNLYQIYFSSGSGTFYMVHVTFNYSFIVQEIKA